MRAMIGELRCMPMALIFFTIEAGSCMLALGAKSLMEDSLQPASTAAAATVAERRIARAKLESICRPVVLCPTRPDPSGPAGFFKGGTVGPLTLKIDYRKR